MFILWDQIENILYTVYLKKYTWLYMCPYIYIMYIFFPHPRLVDLICCLAVWTPPSLHEPEVGSALTGRQTDKQTDWESLNVFPGVWRKLLSSSLTPVFSPLLTPHPPPSSPLPPAPRPHPWATILSSAPAWLEPRLLTSRWLPRLALFMKHGRTFHPYQYAQDTNDDLKVKEAPQRQRGREAVHRGQ